MAGKIQRVPSRHPGAGMDRLDHLCVKQNLRWGLARDVIAGNLADAFQSG